MPYALTLKPNLTSSSSCIRMCISCAARQLPSARCTHGQAASGYDLRSGKPTFHLPAAHKYAARSVDFNPNKPLCCATAGDDRLVKFWDLRRSAAPVRALAGHAHWAVCVKYNRFHDQLVLSGKKTPARAAPLPPHCRGVFTPGVALKTLPQRHSINPQHTL